MIRVHLIVEGQSEEAFVKKTLTPYLSSHEIYVDARAVETGRKGHIRFRGGMTTYQKAKKDIQTWLSEDPTAKVSTMFDLYRLPTDFPGHEESRLKPARDRVTFLQSKLAADIGNTRFIPYIQLHEFEALLFSDPSAIDGLVPGGSNLEKLIHILDSYHGDPELINDSPITAPSKRIEGLYIRYDKVAYGSRIAEKIGVESILERCAHFRSWIESLKSLAD